jgi:cyclopropane fatty-acyl-phospholipid synthase-like methyltransferase
MATTFDFRLSSPAALRNRGPVLDVLRTMLPPGGRVLELASGTGEHITHFATSLPTLTWITSDPSAEARRSIAAWLVAEDCPNVLAPLNLDAALPVWPVDRANAVIAINLVHISPWAATLGLLAGASRILPPGGALYLYGPYIQADRPLADSNVLFDADLRQRNSEWGIRRLDDVVDEAARAGLTLDRVIDMPANNLSVIFVRN